MTHVVSAIASVGCPCALRAPAPLRWPVFQTFIKATFPPFFDHFLFSPPTLSTSNLLPPFLLHLHTYCKPPRAFCMLGNSPSPSSFFSISLSFHDMFPSHFSFLFFCLLYVVLAVKVVIDVRLDCVASFLAWVVNCIHVCKPHSIFKCIMLLFPIIHGHPFLHMPYLTHLISQKFDFSFIRLLLHVASRPCPYIPLDCYFLEKW